MAVDFNIGAHLIRQCLREPDNLADGESYRVIATGCVGSVVYKTPKSLTPGTYTYFCRIHPFMRGSFRVVPKKS